MINIPVGGSFISSKSNTFTTYQLKIISFIICISLAYIEYLISSTVFSIPLYLLPLYTEISDSYSIIFFASMGFTAAILLQVVNVPLFTYIQLAVPQYIKGRVFSTMGVFASSIMPIGILLYGLAYDHIPYWVIHSLSFTALIIITLIFLNTRVIKESKAGVQKVSNELKSSKSSLQNESI